MKLTRIGNSYFDENGNEVKWKELSKLTGMSRSRTRLTMKKLVETGHDVPVCELKNWADLGEEIFKLEQHILESSLPPRKHIDTNVHQRISYAH